MIPSSSKTYVLITGASSGIGREIAITLSKTRRLILNGRDVERLEHTRQTCFQSEQHLIWPYDLTDVLNLGDVLSAFVRQSSVSIGGFVHSAAMLKVLPVRKLPVTDTIAVFNINVISAAEIVRVLTKKNVNSDNLSGVVFISSIASEFGAKGFSNYCSSKAALDGLMRALAVELAPAVRVNSVLPGGVRTSMTEHMYDDPETAARLIRDYPLGVGEPSDIVDAVSFLLSNDSRWITGHQMVVDGGRSANISA